MPQLPLCQVRKWPCCSDETNIYRNVVFQLGVNLSHPFSVHTSYKRPRDLLLGSGVIMDTGSKKELPETDSCIKSMRPSSLQGWITRHPTWLALESGKSHAWFWTSSQVHLLLTLLTDLQLVASNFASQPNSKSGTSCWHWTPCSWVSVDSTLSKDNMGQTFPLPGRLRPCWGSRTDGEEMNKCWLKASTQIYSSFFFNAKIKGIDDDVIHWRMCIYTINAFPVCFLFHINTQVCHIDFFFRVNVCQKGKSWVWILIMWILIMDTAWRLFFYFQTIFPDLEGGEWEDGSVKTKKNMGQQINAKWSYENLTCVKSSRLGMK